MSKIEMGRVYRTRDGREVRVLMTDAGSSHPVVIAYKGRDDSFWWSMHVTPEGRVSQSHEDPRDLIEVKPRIRREVWVNVYRTDDVVLSNCHNTKDSADRSACNDRIACVKLVIDCEEGHGLD